MATETFDVLPVGACADCLGQMLNPQRGRPAYYRDFGAGRSMWALYCEHNQTGCFTFVSPTQEIQWTLVTPIDIQPFLELVARSAEKVELELGSSASHKFDS